MTPEQRKTIDKLFTQDERLVRELADLGGAVSPVPTTIAVSRLLEERATRIGAEIRERRWNIWRWKETDTQSSPPQLLRGPGGDVPPQGDMPTQPKTPELAVDPALVLRGPGGDTPLVR